MDHERKRAHIRRGERAFLPQSRMRHIRWEEAVQHSRNKRSNRPIENPQFDHWDCRCGSIECLANPVMRR